VDGASLFIHGRNPLQWIWLNVKKKEYHKHENAKGMNITNMKMLSLQQCGAMLQTYVACGALARRHIAYSIESTPEYTQACVLQDCDSKSRPSVAGTEEHAELCPGGGWGRMSSCKSSGPKVTPCTNTTHFELLE